MLRPMNATLRPYSWREIEDLLERWIEELKQEITSAALGAVEDIFQARPHGALALGVAGPVDVGRIGEQQQHAALAVIGQRVQIEQLVVGGRRIDLEIAGVDDHAERRGDGQRHGSSRSSA